MSDYAKLIFKVISCTLQHYTTVTLTLTLTLSMYLIVIRDDSMWSVIQIIQLLVKSWFPLQTTKPQNTFVPYWVSYPITHYSIH